MNNSANNVVYRSLAVVGNSKTVASPLAPPTLLKQSQSTTTATTQKQRTVVVVEGAKGVATTASTTIVQPIDSPIPMDMYPLSKTHAFMKDASSLTAAMNKISLCLGGRIFASAGRIEAELTHGTKVRVTAIRDVENGKIVLEFDRLDGCAFGFRHAYLKSLCEASEFLDIEVDETQHLFEQSEKRLALWASSSTKAECTSLPSLSRSSVQVSV